MTLDAASFLNIAYSCSTLFSPVHHPPRPRPFASTTLRQEGRPPIARAANGIRNTTRRLSSEYGQLEHPCPAVIPDDWSRQNTPICSIPYRINPIRRTADIVTPYLSSSCQFGTPKCPRTELDEIRIVSAVGGDTSGDQRSQASSFCSRGIERCAESL